MSGTLLQVKRLKGIDAFAAYRPFKKSVMGSGMKIGIGIATAGRREQLALTLQVLAELDPLPECVVIAPAKEDDFDGVLPMGLAGKVRVVRGARGLCAQRNTILGATEELDILVFFDDDFYPAKDYLACVRRVFERHPDVVATTNHPTLDGATGPGVAHEEALRALRGFEQSPPPADRLAPMLGYGCNMSIRLAPVRTHGVRFDEALPLYGWLEDLDFTSRLSRYGRSVQSQALRGVHLGTKRGRSPGKQLGYSQVVNPIYLWRKGSLDHRFALRQVARNVGKNLVCALSPEPWVDRRGRLFGNAMALGECLLGLATPGRALRY